MRRHEDGGTFSWRKNLVGLEGLLEDMKVTFVQPNTKNGTT
jgi:hypothetical protein